MYQVIIYGQSWCSKEIGRVKSQGVPARLGIIAEMMVDVYADFTWVQKFWLEIAGEYFITTDLASKFDMHVKLGPGILTTLGIADITVDVHSGLR